MVYHLNSIWNHMNFSSKVSIEFHLNSICFHLKTTWIPLEIHKFPLEKHLNSTWNPYVSTWKPFEVENHLNSIWNHSNVSEVRHLKFIDFHLKTTWIPLEIHKFPLEKHLTNIRFPLDFHSKSIWSSTLNSIKIHLMAKCCGRAWKKS